jgi:hypothetical protein
MSLAQILVPNEFLIFGNFQGVIKHISAGTGMSVTNPDGPTVLVSLSPTSVIPGTYTNTSLTVNSTGQLTAASSGSTPTIFEIDAGQGITITDATGPTATVSLTNTSVSPSSYTYMSGTVNSTGQLTAASSGVNPILGVTGGTGITVSTSMEVANISLTNTAVTPSSYTNTNLTVNAQGQITAASSGTSGTISDLTSSGGTITITSATGPTTNIDLPNKGTAGTTAYPVSITQDAQGRVTADSGSTGNLAALDGLSSTGIVCLTGTHTFVDRTLTSSGSTITVTNPGGVAGNLNVDLPNVGTSGVKNYPASITTDSQGRISATTNSTNLSSLDGLASTGLVCQTAAGTFSDRTIVSNESTINITNPGGVAGNIILDQHVVGFSAWKTGSQSIANNSNVLLTGWTQTNPSGAVVGIGNSSFVNSTGIFTAPGTGTYEFFARVCWQSSATTTSRIARFLYNGTDVIDGSFYISPNDATNSYPSNILFSHLSMNSGDTMSLQVFQSSGASLNVLQVDTSSATGTSFYGRITGT